MADLVKLKTGKIDKLASVDQDNKPVVPLEAGNVYFAVDTTTHKGKIVYDAPNGTSVDRIVMSTDAEKADSADKALTADKAVTLVAARNIDGINFNGGANVIHYTTCATNASKVEKIVTINGFALISGARISVRFANTNSADSPTLNVSGTGAKPILYNGTNIPTAYLTNNKVWDFIYDGDLDAWIFVGDKNIDTNTTYTEATATKSGLMSASDKTKLDTIQSGAKVVNYESHLASGVKVGTITIGGTATDIFSTTDTWTAFKGATANAAGSAGYIGNAPAAGEQNAFFTGAGTWKTLTVADDKNNGLMSSDDRTKLDSIESNANYTYLNASAPISVNKHVGTITISHNASGATATTYGTNSSTALAPGFGESFKVAGFRINTTGHVTSASDHNVKMPDTLVDDTHRGLMSSDMYLAWNKGITLAGHQLLLGSAWSKTDFLDTLGLTNALRWIGNATVAIADGSKTDPKITGYDFSKAKPGDVVLDKDNKREYAWTLAGAWESLGPDGDLATADHRHANATSTTDGFMSADDKAKLDTVESKANYIYVSANAPISVNKHVGALTITHNTSGVTAGAYGDAVAQAPGFGASFLVPNLTVNATGHVTVAGAHTVTIPNALVTDKINGLMSADDKARFDIIKDGYYVKRAGDTMTGNLYFSNVGTGIRQIRFQAGGSDYGRFAVGATDSDAGYVEIASADNGNEPIYVRQYTGPFATVKRTLTLLDASGNTILPGTLTAAGATINGATTINSTLHTTGATTLDSTLSVGGTATMKGALNVNGAATIGSNLTVAGTSTLNGPLVTNGAVTFNNVAFNYAGMEMAGVNAFRHVWFSDSYTKGKPVYNDNFVYNPATAQLWIRSIADASSTTKTGALIIGADNGNQIAIDDNEIIARNKSTAGTLYLQYEGGRIETQAIIHNGNGTDATSTTTGSIQTAGGVGIVKQLRVGGATNLGSSLTVASGTSIGGALSVGGNTTLNGTLTVNGATSHNATVTFANGIKNVVGDDCAMGDFNVAGTLGFQGQNGTTALALLKRGETWGTSANYAKITYDGSTVSFNKTITGTLSGNASTATKWATGRTLTIGSTGKTVDGSGNVSWSLSEIGAAAANHLHDKSTITSVYEANLVWGGKNFAGSYGCIDAAMVDVLGANRLMFAKAAGITIEYSRDNGATWLDYGATDVQKIGLFSNGYDFYIGKADSTNKATAHGTDYQLRVTLSTGAASIYTELNKFVFYVSTNGSQNCTVTIDRALESTPTTFVNVVNNIPISGWSGYNVVNINKITTYGNIASSQYGHIRFTFKANGGKTTYNGLSVSQIMGFGGGAWRTPSTMAKTGHLYAYDANQNATFPAQITATQFNGALSGNASTATKLKTARAFQTNLASDSANNFDGSANCTMGVTGVLPVKQGGTGATTAAAAKANIGLGNVANIDQSKAIKSITRSGTTFTATALDGTKTTFDQQDNNTTYSEATSSSAGLMSASDKVSLDNAMPRSGGSFTGDVSSNHEISDRYGKMIVSREVNCKNVSALIENVRYTNGCCGSVSFSDAEFIAGVTINAIWFNYIWVPHRTGAYNGQAKNDNCNFGTLILTSMLDNSSSAIFRFTGGKISQVRLLDSQIKSYTLSASGWSDWTQSIWDSLITATSNQEVLPAIGISKEQLIAFQKAMIVDAGQSTGKFTLRVMGTLPTIDIPIRVIFRGTI